MNAVQFAPLRGRRLSAEVEHAITDLILVGRIQPGDKLPSEKALASQFGVSPTTVREALKALEALNIVTRRRGKNGGTVVSGIERDPVKSVIGTFLNANRVSVRDVCQLREMLEPGAARVAATAMTADALRKLDANVTRCEERLGVARDGLSERDLFDIERSNVEFHRLIAEATANPVLVLTIDYLADYLLTVKRRIAAPNSDFTRTFVRQHRAIWLSLKNRDSSGAERKMLSHIAWVADRLNQENRI